jgi:hypothetical protein
MVFVIKAEVRDLRKTLNFTAQKTVYGGKDIAEGDAVFILASENEGGRGLLVRFSLVRNYKRAYHSHADCQHLSSVLVTRYM